MDGGPVYAETYVLGHDITAYNLVCLSVATSEVDIVNIVTSMCSYVCMYIATRTHNDL